MRPLPGGPVEREWVPDNNIQMFSDPLQFSVLLSFPYIILMIFLPLILSICFKDRKRYENFNYLNNLASCGAAFLVCFMGSLISEISAVRAS